MTLAQRCAQSLSRKVYEPLVDARAERLRCIARQGRVRPEKLEGVMLDAWVMGWAEGAAIRNGRVA